MPDSTKNQHGEYISSRDAAKLYQITNDHIARLCRQGKLSGVLEGRNWLVEKKSLERFFLGQRTPRLNEPVRVHYVGVAPLAAAPDKSPAGHRKLVTAFVATLFLAVGGFSFLSPSMRELSGEYVSAALAFTKTGGSFSQSSTRSLAVASSPQIAAEPDGAVRTSEVIQQNVYPVVERIVERVIERVAASEESSATTLQQVENKLRSEFYALLSSPIGNLPSSGGPVNNVALSQRIDKLDGVTISNSSIGGYLSLGGGTLTGSLTGTTGSFSTVTATTASTTNLIVSSLGASAGDCLTTDSSGSVASIACDTFPFTAITFGATAANATSTLIGFTGGIYSLASSTVGNGFAGLTISGAATTTGRAYFAGNVGIATTSPFRTFSIVGAVSTAQQALAYDSGNNTDLLTSSTGDYFVYPSGQDALFNDSNLWVCVSGTGNTNGCPSGTPSGQGNLIVETRVGIASSTPFSALSIGANGAILTTEKALTDQSTITIDWSEGNQQLVTLGGNRTVAFSNYANPGSILRLVVCQDATGSRTVSWPNGTVLLWAGSTAPTLSTAAYKCDVMSFVTTSGTSTVKVLGSSVIGF